MRRGISRLQLVLINVDTEIIHQIEPTTVSRVYVLRLSLSYRIHLGVRFRHRAVHHSPHPLRASSWARTQISSTIDI